MIPDKAPRRARRASQDDLNKAAARVFKEVGGVAAPKKARRVSQPERKAAVTAARKVTDVGLELRGRKPTAAARAMNAGETVGKTLESLSAPHGTLKQKIDSADHHDGLIERAGRSAKTVAHLGSALYGAQTKLAGKELKAASKAINLLDVGRHATDVRTKGHRSPMLAAALPPNATAVTKTAAKAAINAPKDAMDVAVHTPQSLYFLGKTGVEHPKKLPGVLAQPYKDFFKDPRKSFEQHPVQSGLLFYPAGKGGSLAVGKAALKSGKMTLEGGARRVPGSALRQPITKPKGVVGNAWATARAKRGPSEAPSTRVARPVKDGEKRAVVKEQFRAAKENLSPRNATARARSKWSPQTPLTDVEIARHADQFHGYRSRERAAAQSKAGRVARLREKQQAPLPPRRQRKARAEAKVARAQRIDEAMKGALKGVDARLRRELVDRTGATQRPSVLPSTEQAARGKARKATLKRQELTAANKDLYLKRVAAEQTARKARVAKGAKRGVPPGPADALLNAIFEQDKVGALLKEARVVEKRAKREARTARLARQQGHLTQEQAQGRLFSSETDARYMARKVPFDARVVRVGNKFGVVPSVMVDRLARHDRVGTSPAAGAVLMRKARRAFTRTVLPYKPASWITGQVAEPAFRAAVAGVNPLDRRRYTRLIDEMNRIEPGLGDRFRHATLTGGTGKMVGDLEAIRNPSLAEVARKSRDIVSGSFVDRLMRGSSKVFDKGPVKAARVGHNKWADFVFDKVNGQMIEKPISEAFGGRALRNLPELERKLISSRRKDIKQLAKLFADSPTARHAAEHRVRKDVQEGYGQYGNFSPGAREALLHWAPFAPWFVNALKFNLTAPVKHPTLGATMGVGAGASKDWREKNGLSLFAKTPLPMWQQGMLPINGDLVNTGRYLPSSVLQQPLKGATSLLLPNLIPALMQNNAGVDWKGTQVREGDGKLPSDAKNALLALIGLTKSHAGPAGTIDDLFKLTDRKVLGKKNVNANPWDNARLMFNPFMGLKARKDLKAGGGGKNPAGLTDAELKRLVEIQQQASQLAITQDMIDQIAAIQRQK